MYNIMLSAFNITYVIRSDMSVSDNSTLDPIGSINDWANIQERIRLE